ncbi:vWA domain-containing protein [Sulfurovum lithotrophicum]|uniref:vWA domain-containing protein n=1 Tax=Sulfurovum lithotrophicum TaxID=206403 RepID=UPI0006982F6C|nr:VWA domain-containing protein [Sulfurovum lithotrophicum]
MHFTFGSPFFLLLLLLLPCFLWCREHNRTYYFPKLEWAGRESALLSWEPWLKILIYTFLVVALAKPFVYDAAGNQHKKGRDLVLAIDASGSMAQSGFDEKDRFKTKYETTLDLSADFIKHRFDDNMGVVVFGTFAYTASPLTYDLEAMESMLKMTTVGIAGESTAIGDALMQAMRTLSYGEAQSKAIILLTDGYHNAGRSSPKAAVAKAKEKRIKIYTIGVGKSSDYDAALLDTIAKESGGKSYAAASAAQLKEVYKEIDKLEPSPVRGENYLNQRLLIFFPLMAAFLLLLGWVLYPKRSLLLGDGK